MRKRALLFLMLLVTALTALTLFVSIYAFKEQESVTDSMLSAYVSDIAESFAENWRSRAADNWRERWDQRFGNFGNGGDTHHGRWGDGGGRMGMRRGFFFRMFSMDPSLRSGGLLILDPGGRPLGGSAGAEALVSLWREEMIPGVPTEVKDGSGARYLVVIRELESGNYLLVAASKTNLQSSISRVWNVWLILVMASSSAVLAGIAALWRYFVMPIRDIVETIDRTKWGVDAPSFGRSPLFEVDALSGVIEKSAVDAVAKEQLRLRYISDIVQVQEEARRRLARELHDGPLQSVVASIKRVQLAQLALSGGGSARDKLDEAERVSQQAADEIRNYCDELSPSWLALGISSALEEMAERLSDAYGAMINVSAADVDLPEEYALSIIRILQEAVSNSVRHGGAGVIDVNLAFEGDDLVFRVSDDGRGFSSAPPSDFEKLRLEGHRGLSNMRERVQLLGGRLDIDSRQGAGCS
ncbi:MAG: histidine kinase, partial [Synergistaceae bacterium]|nr:histidine kinase [Synergistaceae bacterium]